jgi:hypothetical protein
MHQFVALLMAAASRPCRRPRRSARAPFRPGTTCTVRWGLLAAIAVLTVLGEVGARAQDSGDEDRAVVLETGGAGEWPVRGSGRPNYGGTVAAEITPIENWLELEMGVTALATAAHTELSADFLFKKPYRLSATTEFMFGAGPSLSRTLAGPERGTTWSAEFVLDFMFWRRKNSGWYLEPGWSVSPRNGQQSVGLNVGLIFALP